MNKWNSLVSKLWNILLKKNKDEYVVIKLSLRDQSHTEGGFKGLITPLAKLRRWIHFLTPPSRGLHPLIHPLNAVKRGVKLESHPSLY